jgi:hypothetical protein
MIKRYYVLRDRGPGSDECGICKEWEYTVNSTGGFLFGDNDVYKALNPDSDNRTHLFHTHCRCTLTESPDGIPISDELDRKVLISGALGHIYFGKLNPKERLEMLRKYDD